MRRIAASEATILVDVFDKVSENNAQSEYKSGVLVYFVISNFL